MSLSGIDVRVLVHELSKIVSKSWIVNIYELPGRIFIFKLRESGVGVFFLLFEPGKRIHLTKFNREMPKEPTNFAKTLRSHLRNKMINSIRQQDIDRLIILNIGPDQGYDLIIELFGRGNVILVSPKNKIVAATTYRKMKDRDIHPGREFRPMPAQNRDLIRNGISDFDSFLDTSDKLVPAINNWLGLGPYYSRYILKELSIKTKKVKDLNQLDKNRIIDFAGILKSRLDNNEYNPVVYLEEDNSSAKQDLDGVELQFDEQWEDSELPFKPENVLRISPWKQPIPDENELTILKIENLWEAHDVFYSSQEDQEVLEGESEVLESHIDKLTNQLNEQKSHMENLLKNAETSRKNADALYTNFQIADELIKTVYEAKKNNISWDTIIAKLEEGKIKGIPSAKIFDKIDVKGVKIYFKLENEDEIMKFPLDFRKSLTDNANELYENAKKSERKAKGAEEAIRRTKQKIEGSNVEVKEKLESSKEKVTILKRRKKWYEKFHWTYSPEGVLIIGGFDASSNERIVKRYLEDDDLFIHADLQGASSVVIKKGEIGIGSMTRRLASQMAVSYSSGWKAKLPSANAFIVERDQVSLTPPSGEFLPKGSFMIYGEKSFEKNVPLEIAIGVIIERHWAKIISGPIECIHQAAMYVVLQPGDESRGKIAKQIQNLFVRSSDPASSQKISSLDVSDFALFIPGDSKITDQKL